MKFEISKKEEEKLNSWLDIKKQKGQRIGTLTYLFTPTGIGLNIIVKDASRKGKSDHKIDITDYESW